MLHLGRGSCLAVVPENRQARRPSSSPASPTAVRLPKDKPGKQGVRGESSSSKRLLMEELRTEGTDSGEESDGVERDPERDLASETPELTLKRDFIEYWRAKATEERKGSVLDVTEDAGFPWKLWDEVRYLMNALKHGWSDESLKADIRFWKDMAGGTSDRIEAMPLDVRTIMSHVMEESEIANIDCYEVRPPAWLEGKPGIKPVKFAMTRMEFLIRTFFQDEECMIEKQLSFEPEGERRMFVGRRGVFRLLQVEKDLTWCRVWRRRPKKKPTRGPAPPLTHRFVDPVQADVWNRFVVQLIPGSIPVWTPGAGGLIQ